MKKLIEYYAAPSMGNFTLPKDFKMSGKLGAAGSNKTKSTNRQKPKKR